MVYDYRVANSVTAYMLTRFQFYIFPYLVPSYMYTGSEKKTLTHAQTGTRMSADYFYYVLLVAVVSGLVTIIVTSRSWTMHSDGKLTTVTVTIIIIHFK